MNEFFRGFLNISTLLSVIISLDILFIFMYLWWGAVFGGIPPENLEYLVKIIASLVFASVAKFFFYG